MAEDKEQNRRLGQLEDGHQQLTTRVGKMETRQGVFNEKLDGIKETMELVRSDVAASGIAHRQDIDAVRESEAEQRTHELKVLELETKARLKEAEGRGRTMRYMFGGLITLLTTALGGGGLYVALDSDEPATVVAPATIAVPVVAPAVVPEGKER